MPFGIDKQLIVYEHSLCFVTYQLLSPSLGTNSQVILTQCTGQEKIINQFIRLEIDLGQSLEDFVLEIHRCFQLGLYRA